MTRIVHLTDLHFGYECSEMTPSLLECVNAQRADLVVVTGDLTHRARPGQFAQASRFLAAIMAPTLVVPGNHDIPLYNVASRFFWPWWDYRRATSPSLSPVFKLDHVKVIGINSVDPFSWRRGKLRSRQVDRAIRQLDPSVINLIAVHHPLQHTSQETKGLARNAQVALTRLEDAGAQIVLSGHLHSWSAEAHLLAGPHRRILQIQSGTALCARPGDPPNEFAVLDFGNQSALTVTRHRAEDGAYNIGRNTEVLHLSRTSGQWRILDRPE